MSHFEPGSLDASLDEIIASHARDRQGSRTRSTHKVSPGFPQHPSTPAPSPFRSFVCGPTMDWEPSEEPSTFDMGSLACALPVEDKSFDMGSLTIGLPEDNSFGTVNFMAASTHLNQPSPINPMEGFGGVPFSWQAEWLVRHGLPPRTMDNKEWSQVVKALRASRESKDTRSRSDTLAEEKEPPTTAKRHNPRRRRPRDRDRNIKRRGDTSTSPKTDVVGMLGNYKITKASLRQD